MSGIPVGVEHSIPHFQLQHVNLKVILPPCRPLPTPDGTRSTGHDGRHRRVMAAGPSGRGPTGVVPKNRKGMRVVRVLPDPSEVTPSVYTQYLLRTGDLGGRCHHRQAFDPSEISRLRSHERIWSSETRFPYVVCEWSVDTDIEMDDPHTDITVLSPRQGPRLATPGRLAYVVHRGAAAVTLCRGARPYHMPVTRSPTHTPVGGTPGTCSSGPSPTWGICGWRRCTAHPGSPDCPS